MEEGDLTTMKRDFILVKASKYDVIRVLYYFSYALLVVNPKQIFFAVF